MSKYIVKALKSYLKTPLTATATSIVLRSFVDSKGNELAMSDFGDWGVLAIKQGDTMEMIKFSAVTQDGSSTACTLTVATNGRSIDPTTPYAGGSTGSAFQSGAECIITNDPLTVTQFGNLNNANTWALLQTFTVMPQSSDVPTELNDLINKSYADNLVLGTLTTINLIVPATAGETVVAGDLVYYNTTDKEWKLCDADTASTVENVMIAISQGAGTNGNAITGGVMLRGLDANQTGMTAGDIMYASDTAGEISDTAGTVEVTAGVAKSATQLYFNPRFNQQLTEDQQDALAGDLTTPSSANKYVTQAGLQKGAEIFGADAEASDTYVITLSPAPASYYTGMVINFSANTANTGACTINVNGLGAKSIKKMHDQDPSDGDIESGQIVTLIYDGTNFQMQSQAGATTSTVDIQTFTSSDTWTKPTGAKIVTVEAWGGGGAGGSKSTATSTGTAGGGGGAYVKLTFQADDLSATETVTIGAGGSAVADSDGSTGGTTSFGSLVYAYGGGGGAKSIGADESGGGGGGGLTSAGGTGSETGSGGGGTAGLPPDTFGGGVGGFATPGNAVFFGGGGGGGSTGNGAGGGSSTYGGGGGGGAGNNSTGAVNAGGVSKFGGNGGASAWRTTGVAGTAPSGGGGATFSNNMTAYLGGDGADGQMIVTTFI